MTTTFQAGEGESPTNAVGTRSPAQRRSSNRLVAPFVGRETELTVLEERLNAAERGDGGVVFIRGEPGIGKSRLLEEFATEAQTGGWIVLRGRAYDMDGMPPYLPFIEVLRDQLRHASDKSLAELALGAPELSALLPELRAHGGPGLPHAAGLGPEAERFRLFEAVAGFLIGISRQTGIKGLLVVMDDLHWADRTSVLLLQHIARKLSGVPLLFAAAYRTTEIALDHPLSGVAADLAREHGGKQLALPPLTEGETARLIESLAGAATDHALALNIHKETAGNPFFEEELVRHLLERDSKLSAATAAVNGIPEGVRQVIHQRLSRLAKSTNTALQTAAVLGDSFTFDLLSAASELEAPALIDAVEEAERAGMLREHGDGYTFAHGLIRRTIYDALSLPRRRRNHLRAAEAMESIGLGDLETGRAVVAQHWRLSGHPERATEYLLRAGDAAIAVTAWDEATQYWERALECMEQARDAPPRRARLLEGLGDLYFLSTFQAHPSVERYLQAAAIYERIGDAVGGARARSRAGRSLAFPTSGFDYPAAVEHLHAAEAVLRNEPPSVELGELYAALAHSESHALLQGPEEMLKAMRLVGETAQQLESDFLRDFLRIQSLHLEGHYLGLQGHLARGLALEERACAEATAMRDKPGQVGDWPERWHEFLLMYSSEDEPANANAAGSPHLSHVTSRTGLANFTTNCCGWQSLDLSDPVRAREKHERIRDGQGRFITPFLLGDLYLCGDLATLKNLADAGTSALSTTNPDAVPLARTMQALAEGRWTDVRSATEERARKARAAGSNSLSLTTGRWLLRGMRATGEAAAAESLALDAVAMALRSGAVKYEFIFRAEFALILGEAGRLAEAEENLVRCREILADGEDWRGVGGRLALAEAVVAAARGDIGPAETEFERALAVFRDLSLPWDAAEAFELWARFGRRFHRGAGRRTFIAEKLGEARAVYERIGAGQPWLDRLEEEVRLLSVGGSHTGGEPLPDGLTAREGEVLRLVAAGRSSREIGMDLVLSVRTVERHVANIYLKTGTHGRAQVTAYAVAHGLGSAEV